ncbi:MULTISPECIES: hypothetical protein [unclassified Bradyrhizobium]|uniref:hypothetical protein n=1 Tax=unclassified Bradyrhizobium TaxID=2631580 RepID=UPI001FF8A00B|nr:MULTISPECIES: hypothetical protein [unclassified Bradyrhizobium]MCK1716013.1 hypothetical protein [Bradyrhizobium sp. 143]MCK1728036.1 hypothetical protein [Bradyrhizobium sp. 142]
MFRRKKATGDTVQMQQVCWDDKTQAFFAGRDHFDVYITSVMRRAGFGRSSSHDLGREQGYEISGLMTFPKYLLVELKFDDDPKEFGTWFYHTYDRPDGQHRLPFLEIWLSDVDYAIRQAIASAHRAALVSGSKRSLVRLWKRKGDGIFTTEEAKQGWSCESRYPVTGLLVWDQLESAGLPNWAVPYSHERFSTDRMPQWYDLKLE